MRKPWFCQECRIQMLYDKKQDFHKCPECGTEVWMNIEEDSLKSDEDEEIDALMREKYKANLPAKEPIPAGGALLGGGGSKSKGRSRKGDMKKKSLSQINAGLAGICSAFNC